MNLAISSNNFSLHEYIISRKIENFNKQWKKKTSKADGYVPKIITNIPEKKKKKHHMRIHNFLFYLKSSRSEIKAVSYFFQA